MSRPSKFFQVHQQTGYFGMRSTVPWSESPSQVFMVVIAWMSATLRYIEQDKWSEIFLAYDNMCHLDGMPATKKELPLPAPFNTMWTSGIRKVIDKFHLENHVGHNCHTIYNPEAIRLVHPNLSTWNTQSCMRSHLRACIMFPTTKRLEPWRKEWKKQDLVHRFAATCQCRVPAKDEIEMVNCKKTDCPVGNFRKECVASRTRNWTKRFPCGISKGQHVKPS